MYNNFQNLKFNRLKLCTDTSAANYNAYLSSCEFNGTGCALAAAYTSYSLKHLPYTKTNGALTLVVGQLQERHVK